MKHLNSGRAFLCARVTAQDLEGDLVTDARDHCKCQHPSTMIFRGLLFLISLTTCLGLSNSVNNQRRRQLLETAAGVLLGFVPLAGAAADQPLPVLVLGAGGKTGRECVDALLAVGRPCIATTRSGILEHAADPLLTVAPADVTNDASLSSALTKQPLAGVIFAASASTSGNAMGVDRDGLIATAQLCIASSIPRLVVVSSGAVSRPDSAVYQFLHLAGKGIMKAKIEGEDELRRLYTNPSVLAKGLGYTIVRPGGLTMEPSVGVGALELNQGDSKSGRISRQDVAALCVAALENPDAFDTTFECYEATTAKPLESVGLSNLLQSKDPTAFVSGKERRGETFAALFRGLERDVV